MRNESDRTVTLVLPGDGSAVGLRTPMTGWSFLPSGRPVETARKHPLKMPLQPTRGFAEINALRRSEVFALKPSETRSFDVWLNLPALSAGRYRAVYYYVNNPTARLTGDLLGANEPGAEELIAKSTPCELVSNEITVDVIE